MAGEASAAASETLARLREGHRIRDDGDYESAVSIFDEIIESHATTSDPELARVVAWAINSKAWVYVLEEDRGNAIQTYEQLLGRDSDGDDPELRSAVASARYNRAVQLRELGRDREALAGFDSVLAADDVPGIARLPRDLVMDSVASRQGILRRLGRATELSEAYDDAVRRLGDVSHVEIQAKIAQIMLSKCELLTSKGRYQDVVRTSDELATRFGEVPDAVVRGKVALAMCSKGHALEHLGERAHALAVYRTALRRYSDVDTADGRDALNWLNERQRTLSYSR